MNEGEAAALDLFTREVIKRTARRADAFVGESEALEVYEIIGMEKYVDEGARRNTTVVKFWSMRAAAASVHQ